jgi:Flp pilus assembly protein TadG
MTPLLRLKRDQRGAAAVEFGLIAPAFLLMLLGVFQVGIWLQGYNAMRNAVTQASRSVAVEYQTDNKLTDAQIANTGLAVATTSPFLLQADRLKVEVDDAATQTFTGAREKTITLTYQMPNFLDFAGVPGPTLSYSRSMFLVNE